MSQPCSAVELVLFDARELTSPKIRNDIETIVTLGVLAGAVLDGEHIAQVVEAAGQAHRFDFWFGGAGVWPFERAIAFANVEPGRTLFVSENPIARRLAEDAGLQAHDPCSGDLAQRLP